MKKLRIDILKKAKSDFYNFIDYLKIEKWLNYIIMHNQPLLEVPTLLFVCKLQLLEIPQKFPHKSNSLKEST